MEADRAWLLTPPGAGAIAVIRIRGGGVMRALQSRFSKPCAVMRCVHGELRDEAGDVVDDPLVVLLDAQTADINVHGGGAIIRATLGLFERHGFLIEPPVLDSTFAGDIVTQEMLAALGLPRTQRALSLLLAQPRAWAQQAWTGESAAAALADRSLERLLYPPTVAIVGIANAGKSTLANQLFGQTRSIVLDEPGTTRDYVSDLADLDGLAVHLIDTPGRRQTDDAIEASAIALSQKVIAMADLRLLLLDPTQPAELQRRLIVEYPDALIVANKSDAPAVWPTSAQVRIAANTGVNVHRLVAEIQRRLGLIDNPLRPRCHGRRDSANFFNVSFHLVQASSALMLLTERSCPPRPRTHWRGSG